MWKWWTRKRNIAWLVLAAVLMMYWGLTDARDPQTGDIVWSSLIVRFVCGTGVFALLVYWLDGHGPTHAKEAEQAPGPEKPEQE